MNLRDLYFNWMCDIVFPHTQDRNNYQMLLSSLHSIIFHYSIPMDENRMTDGIDLRYRFADIFGYDPRNISRELSDTNSCTMLEMMVALSIRADESVLYDYETGSKAHHIFMLMLRSLEIDHMSNDIFNVQFVEDRIDRLLNRDYEPNGRGGLFTVNNPRKDLRMVDIWYQMSWAIQELYK